MWHKVPNLKFMLNYIPRRFAIDLSTAPWKNPSVWLDKLEWIQLIISHHKNLNRGDYLIDDREKNGAREFEGKLIPFGSDKFPDWRSVTDYLINKKRPNSLYKISSKQNTSLLLIATIAFMVHNPCQVPQKTLQTFGR